MPVPTKSLEARSFEAFRCIGADCEDTCCYGWGVVIDQKTYERYQRCEDPELKPLLENFVTLNTTDSSEDKYAKITLAGSRCPALSEGLCSLQRKLGEDYLSKTCLTYPRVVNQVDDTLQQSLHLSCPEAARLVLLDPAPVQLHSQERELNTSRVAHLIVLDTTKPGLSGKSYRHFGNIQTFVISLLQNRAYPLWKRLVILGYFCFRLDELLAVHNDSEILSLMQGYADGLSRGLFDDVLGRSAAQPAVQLETMLELIIGHISSDFTNPRFRQCYEQFLLGLQWTSKSSMHDLGCRYTQAYSKYYAPFMARHEYILENYLVNYAYKTLFPLGPQEGRPRSSILPADKSASSQYALMVVYYAVIKTISIGMAAFHKEAFVAGQVVQLIQSTSRAFEHSFSYPDKVIQTLTDKGMQNQAGLAVLIMN